MSGIGGVVASVIGLWMAAIMQTSLAPRLSVGVGQPDFCLVLLAGLGMFYNRRGNTVLGFGAGFVIGALTGVNLTLYVLTRTLMGFMFGWLLSFGVQRNYFVSAMAGLGLTLGAQLLFLFLGGSHGAILQFLAGTLVTSMYDGVIAAVLFLIIDRLSNPHRQERY